MIPLAKMQINGNRLSRCEYNPFYIIKPRETSVNDGYLPVRKRLRAVPGKAVRAPHPHVRVAGPRATGEDRAAHGAQELRQR